MHGRRVVAVAVAVAVAPAAPARADWIGRNDGDTAVIVLAEGADPMVHASCACRLQHDPARSLALLTLSGHGGVIGTTRPIGTSFACRVYNTLTGALTLSVGFAGGAAAVPLPPAVASVAPAPYTLCLEVGSGSGVVSNSLYCVTPP